MRRKPRVSRVGLALAVGYILCGIFAVVLFEVAKNDSPFAGAYLMLVSAPWCVWWWEWTDAENVSGVDAAIGIGAALNLVLSYGVGAGCERFFQWFKAAGSGTQQQSGEERDRGA